MLGYPTKKLRSISCDPPVLGEDIHEKTFHGRAFVSRSDTLHPVQGSYYSPCVRKHGFPDCIPSQKEKQTQEDEKAEDLEGPSRPAQIKTRIGISVPENFDGVKPKRGARRLPVSALLFSPSRRSERLWRYAPRARCDVSYLCSKPGGVNLTSWLIELQFFSTPLERLWQAGLCNFHALEAWGRFLRVSVLLS
jgi:hypothetical protein